MSAEEKQFAMGVDVGGTKVAAGIVNRAGEIVATTRVPMNAKGSAEEGFAGVTQAIDSLWEAHVDKRAFIRGIGICAPGPLDPKTGVVINPPNVPCWRNFPLAARVTQKYGLPVKVENDANAAALAESLWGAGRGYKNVFYVCLGTGIGTGIIFDGKIYNGRTGAAAEGGHVSIDYQGPVCNCGKRGCIEVYASGTSIGKRARARLLAEPTRATALRELAGPDLANLTSEMVGTAFRSGDALATEILRETVEFFSIWLGNTIDLIEPDVIIVGGGVAAMLQPLFSEMQERVAAWCINSRGSEIPLVPAFYAGDAGIAGGAALCG